MKLSEVTDEIIAEHCRVSEQDIMLRVYWDAAVKKVLGYTGIDEAEADRHDDLTVAALVLARDMFDNKGYHVDGGSKANKVVDGILALHDNNLLPEG